MGEFGSIENEDIRIIWSELEAGVKAGSPRPGQEDILLRTSNIYGYIVCVADGCLRFYYTHEILDAIATNSEESSLDPALSKSIDLKKQTPIAIELHNGDLSVSVAAEDGIWLEYRVEDIFASSGRPVYERKFLRSFLCTSFSPVISAAAFVFSDNTAEIIDTLSRQTIFSVEGVILVSWSKKDALLSCAKADGSIEIINDASEVVCAVSQVEEVHPSVPAREMAWISKDTLVVSKVITESKDELLAICDGVLSKERTWSYGVNVIHLDEDRIHLSKYYFSYIEDVSENKMSTLLCVNRASLGILLIVYDKSSGKWNMITTPELEEFQMPLSEMGDVDDMFPVSLDIDLTNTRTIPGRSPSDRKNRIAPVIIIYSNLSNIISLYYDVRKPALDMLMSERSPLPTKAQTAAGDKKPESYLDSSAVIKKEVTFSESAAIILKDPLENSSAEISLGENNGSDAQISNRPRDYSSPPFTDMAAAAHGDKTSSFFFKDPEFSPPKISLHSHTETTDAKNDDMQHLSEAESPVILVERDAVLGSGDVSVEAPARSLIEESEGRSSDGGPRRQVSGEKFGEAARGAIYPAGKSDLEGVSFEAIIPAEPPSDTQHRDFVSQDSSSSDTEKHPEGLEKQDSAHLSLCEEGRKDTTKIEGRSANAHFQTSYSFEATSPAQEGQPVTHKQSATSEHPTVGGDVEEKKPTEQQKKYLYYVCNIISSVEEDFRKFEEYSAQASHIYSKLNASIEESCDNLINSLNALRQDAHSTRERFLEAISRYEYTQKKVKGLSTSSSADHSFINELHPESKIYKDRIGRKLQDIQGLFKKAHDCISLVELKGGDVLSSGDQRPSGYMGSSKHFFESADYIKLHLQDLGNCVYEYEQFLAEALPIKRPTAAEIAEYDNSGPVLFGLNQDSLPFTASGHSTLAPEKTSIRKIPHERTFLEYLHTQTSRGNISISVTKPATRRTA